MNKSVYIFKAPNGNLLHIKKNNVAVVFNSKGEPIKVGRIDNIVEKSKVLIQKGYKRIK